MATFTTSTRIGRPAIPTTTTPTTPKNSSVLSKSSLSISPLSIHKNFSTSLFSSSKISFSSICPTNSRHKTLPATITTKRVKPVLCSTSQSNSTIIESFHGICYVVGDDIDTYQIIPAEHLTLLPSKPDEYEKLGSCALSGLPASSYSTPFIEPGETKTKFSVIIAGSRFGCGSSREHAPVALGASGVKAVVANSYARSFFKNPGSSGEVYLLRSEGRICDEFSTGDLVTVKVIGVGKINLNNHTTGKEYVLKPSVGSGGIILFDRKTRMIVAAGKDGHRQRSNPSVASCLVKLMKRAFSCWG